MKKCTGKKIHLNNVLQFDENKLPFILIRMACCYLILFGTIINDNTKQSFKQKNSGNDCQ